jgi:hypothetical protein
MLPWQDGSKPTVPRMSGGVEPSQLQLLDTLQPHCEE